MPGGLTVTVENIPEFPLCDFVVFIAFYNMMLAVEFMLLCRQLGMDVYETQKPPYPTGFLLGY